MSSSEKVVIVGGGVAGLSCAHRLHQAGVPFILLEAADGPGGRVRTDEHEGFLLDRGFQVLLTAYPEAGRLLNYKKLALRKFTSGALIRSSGKFHRLVDPWRQPFKALPTAFSPIGSFVDKLRIAKLRARVTSKSLSHIFHAEDRTTLAELKSYQFSDKIIDQFFRPFFGGVFLDHDLVTSSRMFNFVFQMFSKGAVTVPGEGIGQISQQLTSGLPSDRIQFGCPVENVQGNVVQLEDGTTVSGRAIVLATGGEATARLLGRPFGTHQRRRVACVYFRTTKAPLNEPCLVLDGEGRGPVNNLCVPSLVAPQYAPKGQHLISTSILEDWIEEDLESKVLEQMRSWYGRQVNDWEHLRTYHITEALPNQAAGVPPVFAQGKLNAKLYPDLYLCGDFCTQGSLNAAMYSGRLIAEEVAEAIQSNAK